MAGDPYRKVRPGDKPNHVTWNELLVMLSAFKRGGSGVFGGGRPGLAWDSGLCLVRNDSGAAVTRGAVLGIDSGLVISPTDNLPSFQERPILKGVAPTLADHRTKFLITLEPLAADKIGWAVLSGIVPVQLEVTANTETARFAKIIADETTKLELSHAGLFPVKAIDSGTGTKWGLVEIGGSPSRLVLAQTTAVITAPGSTTVDLYAGTKGSETDTGETLTALLLRYSELADNQKCHVLCDDSGEEIVIGDPCP